MIEWRKSTRSDQGQADSCVELAQLPGAVGIRDSKNPAKPHLTVARETLKTFFTRIRSGELDR